MQRNSCFQEMTTTRGEDREEADQHPELMQQKKQSRQCRNDNFNGSWSRVGEPLKNKNIRGGAEGTPVAAGCRGDGFGTIHKHTAAA